MRFPHSSVHRRLLPIMLLLISMSSGHLPQHGGLKRRIMIISARYPFPGSSGRAGAHTASQPWLNPLDGSMMPTMRLQTVIPADVSLPGYAGAISLMMRRRSASSAGYIRRRAGATRRESKPFPSAPFLLQWQDSLLLPRAQVLRMQGTACCNVAEEAL